MSENHSINHVLLTIFSLAVYFSLLSSGSLSVSSDFKDELSPIRSSTISSASASSGGGGEEEEGGGDQGGDEGGGGQEEQGGEPEETAPPEDDDETGTEPDTVPDDDQQVPTTETSPTDPLAIAPTPTLTPAPSAVRGLLPTLPPEWVRNCIQDPTLPECQPKTPTPTPSPFGALRGGLTPGDQTLKGICILDPSDPRCPLGLTPGFTFPPYPLTPTGQKTPGESQTPRILCVINPSHPDCQPTTLATTLGSQSLAPDLTRALNPTPTTGEQVMKTPIAPKILCVVNPSHPQCQSTQSSVGNLLPSPFTPDPLLSGPKSGSGGSVPLGDPALVPGPDEEGVSQGEPCIAFPCFPYPLSQDEICRNGMDDDFDGKVDETIYCSEVPGESKPKPRTDDVLVPIPGSPLGPPQN